MPLILYEDEGKKLNGKQAIVPKKLSDELNKRKGVFSDYKKSKGWKRLNSLTGDYNKRSDKANMTSDGRKIVSFSDLKRIDFDMRHMEPSKKNLEYQMLGSDTKQWVHDQLGKIRSANKKVGEVKPVPKLEKPKDASVEVDDKVKVGGANFKISESGKRKIFIPESKLVALLEDRNQLMFNYDENGNPFFGKFNYQHFIDFLESIGKYGSLPASGFDKRSLAEYINNFKDDSIENYVSGNVDDEDTYNMFVSVLAEKISNYINGKGNIGGILTDNGEELVRYFIENGITDKGEIEDYISSEITVLAEYFNDEALEIMKTSAFNNLENRIRENGFVDELVLNERGLLYVERNITIPYSMGHGKDAYKAFKDNFSGAGNCWSWKLGNGESYNAKRYDEGESDIRMAGYVNPKDVNWVVTLDRNIYSLFGEKEIFINSGKDVEICSVRIMKETPKDGNSSRESSQSTIELLNGPLIIKT